MAHKTLVDATAYEICSGRTLVDGTAYSIDGGKTLVNGTVYDVSFGVTWAKYSCDVTTMWTMYDSSYNWAEWSYKADINGTCGTYSSWGFSESGGFYGVNYVGGKYLDNVGNYMVELDRVTVIQSVVDNGDGTITVTRKPTEVAYSTKYYRKGSTFYGNIEVDDSVLPEEGTLLSGSINGSYCVVKVGSTTYYYEKVA